MEGATIRCSVQQNQMFSYTAHLAQTQVHGAHSMQSLGLPLRVTYSAEAPSRASQEEYNGVNRHQTEQENHLPQMEPCCIDS